MKTKYNDPKPMGHSGSSKREKSTAIRSLHQDLRISSNKQFNLRPKENLEKEQIKTQNY